MHDRSIHTLSVSDAERLLAFGAGSVLFIAGASRRSAGGLLLAASSLPLFYHALSGRWPPALSILRPPADTHTALGGDGGVHVRESVRLARPLEETYRSWRELGNLPRFMSHLDRVTEMPNGTSHWVAAGPGGLAVEWDAEIVNEVENHVIGWRSLPGSDVVTAGSVHFDAVRGGRFTQVTVHLQYAAPAGKAGAFVAALFGREPSQTIREDLRRFKRQLEAGEVPRATASEGGR